MKLVVSIFVVTTLFGTVACSGGSDNGPADQAGAMSAASTHSQTFDFTCTTSDSDFPTALSLTTGSTAKVDATFDDQKHKGTQDLTYHPTAANADFIRIQWDKDNDPWSDSGSSWLLVHKDLLKGKSGAVKYQASGEAFETNDGTCKLNLK